MNITPGVPRLPPYLRAGVALVALVALTLGIPRESTAQAPVVVRSSEAPAWGTAVRLVEELRIGVLDGDPDYVLGRVGQVAIGPNGQIIIADDAAPALRVFDANGRFVRVIGRNGEGPGEYRSMGGVATLRDGRIQLWDNRIQRLTTYSAIGEYLGAVRVPSGLFSADLFHVDHEGFAYVRTTVGMPLPNEAWQFGWSRVSPDGVVLDTLKVPTSTFAAPSFVLSTPSGYDRPFPRELVSTMSSRGALLVGDNRTYAFEQRRPGAATIRVERAYQPIALLAEERTEWEAWARMFEQQAANRPAAPKGVIGGGPRTVKYDIPRDKPPFSELDSDADGRIWVRRYAPAVYRKAPERAAGDKRPKREWREPPTYDVFLSDGKFLGTVVLPWNSRLEEAIGNQVWVTGTGEAGEEFVARYRIETGSR